MRIVRAPAAAVVLALLGLLVWDMTHSATAGVAAKVDKGQTVPAPKRAAFFGGGRHIRPGGLPWQGRRPQLLGVLVRRLQARGEDAA